MRIRTLMTRVALVMSLLVAPSGVAFAGHHEHGEHGDHGASQEGAMERAEDTAAADAEQLEENVEDAAAITKATYDAERAAGEGRVEAAGDAYTAVVEQGRKKAAEADEAESE